MKKEILYLIKFEDECFQVSRVKPEAKNYQKGAKFYGIDENMTLSGIANLMAERITFEEMPFQFREIK